VFVFRGNSRTFSGLAGAATSSVARQRRAEHYSGKRFEMDAPGRPLGWLTNGPRFVVVLARMRLHEDFDGSETEQEVRGALTKA
jgi:hypothetical protein